MGEPYHSGHDVMIEQMEDDSEPLTSEQMANTWFERIVADAKRIEMLEDLPF